MTGSKLEAEQTSSTEGTTDMQVIDGRMPDSVKAVGFVEGFGSTFECPECSTPVEGDTCDECGHTPKAMRDDPDN